MSKNWYPVIDYGKCTECGTCVEYCGSGVYDIKKAPTPDIIFGDGCYEGCHGCGNLCPAGAITYIGENTDWTPPNAQAEVDAGCGCDCGGKC